MDVATTIKLASGLTSIYSGRDVDSLGQDQIYDCVEAISLLLLVFKAPETRVIKR